MKSNKAVLFVPDGLDAKKAWARTTHLCIAAHQDDVELMAYAGIAECFGREDKWFGAVVTADGAGSPRNGLYADFTDEDMKRIRVREQNKAAYVGEYSAMAQLGYTSAQIKDGANRDVAADFAEIIAAAQPDILYTHNPADKHDTHLGVCVKVIEALRSLKTELRPRKLLGCEVWRNLDWVRDDQKVVMNTAGHPNIAAAAIGVFDSQIAGGKRYDLAAEGRRRANATYFASHSTDESDSLNFAIDMTALMHDDTADITDYIVSYIEQFKRTVCEALGRVTKK